MGSAARAPCAPPSLPAQHPECYGCAVCFLHYLPMQTKLVSIAFASLSLGGCALGGAIAPQTAYVAADPAREQTLPVVRAPERIADELALLALGQLGVPYANGGNDPIEGFDCSGLVGYVYGEAAGLRLPRTTEALARTGTPVAMSDLNPGDLVFYDTLGRTDSHVGIYLGDHRFVHAPSSGGVVRVDDMRQRYWVERYSGARHIVTR